MATSTGSRTMASLLLSALAMAGIVPAQMFQSDYTVAPTDYVLGDQLPFRLTINSTAAFIVAPLTPEAGQGQIQTKVDVSTSKITGHPSKQRLIVEQVYHIVGNIRLASAMPSQSNIGSTDIAYITCDPDSSGFIATSQTVNNIADQQPKAVVLYSTSQAGCNLTGETVKAFTTIYTMTSLNDSAAISKMLGNSTGTTSIPALVSSNDTSTGSGNNNSNADTSNGPAPTTAVAMSILYSITGIITLLFLVIIATGAIRAHRHPERYGPRAGAGGRTRQSRAKGLARAMLETLPIVKFGDPEPAKTEGTEVELEDGTNSIRRPHTTEHLELNDALKEIPPNSIVESGMNDNAKASSTHEGHSPEALGGDGELGCSICTEDFTTGEDVRVLPCKHKYHPACIDPWLLNVSGTCPLWYVSDLHYPRSVANPR